MPEPDFTILKGDTASRIESTAENSGGTAVSVENAIVIFRMAPLSGGTLTVAGTATIDQVGAGTTVGGSMGQVHYDWTATDTAAAGWYVANWQVTFASGTVQTFPNSDPLLIAISEDIST